MIIIDEKFFIKLKDEIVPIIQSLSVKQTLDTTEEEIRNIMTKWNDDIIVAETGHHTPELAQDQIVRNLCSIVMSFILLYRQRYLNELGCNPSNFITEFLKYIIPESLLKNKDKRNIEKNILSLLSNVTPSEWARIASPINPKITILVWDKISDSSENNNTIISSIEALDQQSESLTIEHIPLGGTYEEYKSVIDQMLQSEIKQPDLILMDSILLAEYKSKGALYTANYYISEEELKGKKHRIMPELEIGKTVNGNIEAVPITRNFHVAGYGDGFLMMILRKSLTAKK